MTEKTTWWVLFFFFFFTSVSPPSSRTTVLTDTVLHPMCCCCWAALFAFVIQRCPTVFDMPNPSSLCCSNDIYTVKVSWLHQPTAWVVNAAATNEWLINMTSSSLLDSQIVIGTIRWTPQMISLGSKTVKATGTEISCLALELRNNNNVVLIVLTITSVNNRVNIKQSLRLHL